MNIGMSLENAVQQQADKSELQTLCISLLKSGVSPHEILAEFELIRCDYLFKEEYEDVILDLMDELHWQNNTIK